MSAVDMQVQLEQCSLPQRSTYKRVFIHRQDRRSEHLNVDYRYSYSIGQYNSSNNNENRTAHFQGEYKSDFALSLPLAHFEEPCSSRRRRDALTSRTASTRSQTRCSDHNLAREDHE
jgi:hypothetical protein